MSDTAVFDALATTLADAHERFGAAAFTNRRRLTGLLADHVADARREIRAVGTAIDEGVPNALTGCERHLIGMEMDRLAERLEATTGLRFDIARPIVRSFAYALGLGPLPSIYVVTTPVPTPVPPAPQSIEVPRAIDAASPSPVPTPVMPSQPMPAPSAHDEDDDDVFIIGGRAIPKTQAYLGGGGLLLVLASLQLLGDRKPARPVGPTPVITATVVPASNAGGSTGQRLDYGQPIVEQNYANESTDFGIASKATLESNVGSRTPLLVPGGRRITTAALQKMLASEPATVVVDVLDSQHPRTVRGAKFLPGLGNGGSTDDQLQPRFATALAQATDNRKVRPVVFFCYGAECWESYNAVLRAAAAGYINLYWYRGGILSWQAAGLPTDATPSPSG